MEQRPDGGDQSSGAAQRGASGVLATELRGDLKCARCHYNLRGLSITTVCPECGVPVRATLLHTVDPMAAELRPVRMAWVTAHGLIVWTGGALLAAGMVWCLRLVELLGYPAWAPNVDWMRVWVVVSAGLSGVGALVLVRPQTGLARWMSVMSGAGCVLYVALCVLLYRVHVVMDVHAPPAYGVGTATRVDRAALHLVELVVLGAILLLLRPVARHLQARSFLMRTGRVDRQTMAAMLAVLGVIALGDVLVIGAGGGGGPVQDVLRLVGQLVILLGSVLFSLGLVGMLVDTVRMRGVILEPPLGIEQIVGVAEGGASSTPTPTSASDGRAAAAGGAGNTSV